MKRISVIFTILILSMSSIYSQDIKKYYFNDRKELSIYGISDSELYLEIYDIKQPGGFFFSKETNRGLIESCSLEPVKVKRNLFEKILYFLKSLFSKERNFNYRIEFGNLREGLYFFQFKGKSFERDYYILLSRYKLITKLLYNTCNNYLIDTLTGKPVKDYKMFLISKKGEISLSSEEEYFHNVSLEREDYGLVASCSNQYDLNIIKETQIKFSRPVNFINIILKKVNYSIGENLVFNILLKEEDGYQYNNVPVSSVEISIYDNQN